MWWRNGKKRKWKRGRESQRGSRLWPRLSPCGPRNVTDNIWCLDTDESIINMPGWGEWVREDGEGEWGADEWWA